MMTITSALQKIRSRKFWAMVDDLGLDPEAVARMIETGWTATVETHGGGTEIILVRTSVERISITDGRSGAEWASEFNRRSREIHTPS